MRLAQIIWPCCIRLTLPIIALTLAICAGCRTSQPKAGYQPNWLPGGAQIVFRSQWKDGFLPDATFKLKAKVSADEFASAVQRLGLTPHTKDRKYTDDTLWLQWMRDDDERWNPSPSIDETFVHQEGDSWQLAKYENGFLFYQSLSH